MRRRIGRRGRELREIPGADRGILFFHPLPKLRPSLPSGLLMWAASPARNTCPWRKLAATR